MGIRYLQTFLCNDVPDGYFLVNIGHEIQNWRKQNDGRAVIVFDVMGLLNISLQSNTDILLGGRHHIVLRKYDEFFKKLKVDYGAELIFFCDGRVQRNKNDIWIERQNDKYDKTIKIFDKIEQSNGSLDFMNTLRNDDFPGFTTTVHGLVKTCRRHGELKLAMNGECDTELSRYATEHEALAVIADDTDFLIYEGNWKYWSARNLNFVELTTMEYCRPALRVALGLAQKQLPIFATLAGNDIIRQEHVQSFHRRLRLTRYNRFDKLAQFVRSLARSDVNSISMEIFRTTSPQHVDLVRESINTYDINYKISNEMDTLTQRSTFETCFYTFLNAQPYNIILMFFDLRRRDFLAYFDIFVPIVKRQVGFIRQHKNEDDYKQLIVTKVDHNQSFKEFRISPEYPKMKLPSLLEITFDSGNESLTPLRFELLNWLIFGYELTLKIEEITENFMVLLTTLKFLLNINQITAKEADAVLLCVHEIHQRAVPNVLTHTKATTRSIMVSHLYARMHNTILICFKFVGLERFADYLIFDGPYFMVLLERLSVLSEIEYDRTIAGIQEHRKFLF